MLEDVAVPHVAPRAIESRLNARYLGGVRPHSILGTALVGLHLGCPSHAARDLCRIGVDEFALGVDRASGGCAGRLERCLVFGYVDRLALEDLELYEVQVDRMGVGRDVYEIPDLGGVALGFLG